MKQRLIITRYELSISALMVSFYDQTECARPFEVDIKFNGWSVDGGDVVDDRGDFLTKCTVLVVVNLILKMFQTNSEFSIASPATISIAF